MIVFFSFFLSTGTFAQFCQTWALTSDTTQTANSGASTTGNPEIKGSGMATPSYTNSGGFTWQRFTSPVGNWPKVVNTANGIYLEFQVTASAGNNLVVNTISFSSWMSNSSGSLFFNVYDGTTSTGIIGTVSSGTSVTPDNVSITGLSITVPAGTTKSIRLYITSPALPANSTRTLHIRNMVICGTSASSSCANATMASNSTVAAGNIGNSSINNILTCQVSQGCL